MMAVMLFRQTLTETHILQHSSSVLVCVQLRVQQLQNWSRSQLVGARIMHT